MERCVFYVLVVFLMVPVPSRLQETEPLKTCQDPCPELKHLRELVYQQTATVSEIKVKMLYKNQEHLMHLGEYDKDGTARHVSGALVLQLEVGDVVYLRLLTNYALYDDTLLRNTFSGFLIFSS